MTKTYKLFLLIVVTFCTACAEPPDDVMRIGTNIWPGYEPLYLAKELGYLEDSKVRLIEYTSASQVIKAFKNGLLDAAALTLDEAIKLQDSGEQFRIILVLDISSGADVLLGQKSIKSMPGIKGKRIGVEHTALGAYFMARAMEVHNLKNDDIILVPLEVNQHERAFNNKQIDAVVTFEPVRSKLLSTGANILFDSSQIPGEIVDVLIVNEDKLSVLNINIVHLKSAWFRALNEFEKNPGESAKIMDIRMKLGFENVLKAFDGLQLPDEKQNDLLLYAWPEPDLLVSSRRLSKVMFDKSITQKLVDTENIFIKK